MLSVYVGGRSVKKCKLLFARGNVIDNTGSIKTRLTRPASNSNYHGGPQESIRRQKGRGLLFRAYRCVSVAHRTLQGVPALVTFVTAGYPTRDDTVPMLLAMQEGGADIIELGVPFSDPIADGPVIQETNTVRDHVYSCSAYT